MITWELTDLELVSTVCGMACYHKDLLDRETVYRENWGNKAYKRELTRVESIQLQLNHKVNQIKR